MAKRKNVKLSKKELKYRQKLEVLNSAFVPTKEEPSNVALKTISVPHVVAIRALADLSGLPPTKIIQALFKNGVMVTINESIDSETAMLVGEELGLNITEEITGQEVKEDEAPSKNLTTRPPIVTVMGHVDHGKTKLLDAIRQTNVVASESGGITQHIGAYQVEVPSEKTKRLITFLDTPGHEAFSALRAHGANLTDIVVLVVAADDGVKAQTLEAISHAKAAQVPIIVAINKIDLPEADPERVKRELSEHGLLPEDWGGNVPMVLVSAKDGKNIKALLEMIILVADLKELQADAVTDSKGTVIESHIDAGVGVLATVLIERGTLKSGQIVVVGNTWGKIRFMEDWLGTRIKEALPAMPVRIAGLKAVPAFGDNFNVVADEKTAKKFLEDKTGPGNVRSVAESKTLNEFRIIIKSDVVGSLQAIKASLNDIGSDKVTIKILAESIGAISESDVNLAAAADAQIYGFRVDIPKPVAKLAERESIEIKTFDTIYKLLEDLYATIEKGLTPEIVEETIGSLKVLKVFFQTPTEGIIGGKITAGKLIPDLKVNIKRDDVVIGQGKITSLKVGPTPVDEVNQNDECGLQIYKKISGSDEYKLKEGDVLDGIKVTKIITKLTQTEK